MEGGLGVNVNLARPVLWGAPEITVIIGISRFTKERESPLRMVSDPEPVGIYWYLLYLEAKIF